MSRPRFNPTSEQRGMVKSMAAMGILHELIASKNRCPISEDAQKTFSARAGFRSYGSRLQSNVHSVPDGHLR